jgi:hypothetical protein
MKKLLLASLILASLSAPALAQLNPYLDNQARNNWGFTDNMTRAGQPQQNNGWNNYAPVRQCVSQRDPNNGFLVTTCY